MYKSDYDAAYQRAQALERELAEVKAKENADAQRVAALEQSLQAAQATIARMRSGGAPAPMNPHAMPSNATTVLILGILSVTICSLMGPLAWHYGNDELNRIDSGISNPLKRGEVVAGRILGMIATILMGIGLLFAFFIIAAG